VASIVLVLLSVYLLAGCLFALVFITLGLRHVDGATAAAPLTFRLMIFPGVILFWPILMRKWIVLRRTGT